MSRRKSLEALAAIEREIVWRAQKPNIDLDVRYSESRLAEVAMRAEIRATILEQMASEEP